MTVRFDPTIRTVERLIVHSGTFHSDDVFCGAIARILNPGVEIKRVADTSNLETDVDHGVVLADIGMGAFDHHQKDCPFREDGIKHCGASRMWLTYGTSVVRKICKTESLNDRAVYHICCAIYSGILRTISALDNGTDDFPKEVFSIATIIEGFRPAWDDTRTYDECYETAVGYMQTVLANEILRYKAEAKAESYVLSCIERMRDSVVVLERYCPWKDPVIADQRIKIVIYPSLRGGWNLEPVPNEKEEVTYRITIPEQWRGLRGEDALHQCKGMTFCHAKGFLCAFDLKENAIAAAMDLVKEC